VFPTATEENYYTDTLDATTTQALEVFIEILEQQEENLELASKQEWMEEWLSKNNP
jgi:hypothetical protein